MEMQLFGDDLRVEVDIWELFQFHDRRDRTEDLVTFYDLFVVLTEPGLTAREIFRYQS